MSRQRQDSTEHSSSYDANISSPVRHGNPHSPRPLYTAQFSASQTALLGREGQISPLTAEVPLSRNGESQVSGLNYSHPTTDSVGQIQNYALPSRSPVEGLSMTQSPDAFASHQFSLPSVVSNESMATGVVSGKLQRLSIIVLPNPQFPFFTEFLTPTYTTKTISFDQFTESSPTLFSSVHFSFPFRWSLVIFRSQLLHRRKV